MVPAQKLTKEEEWLEKTFKVDVSKFNKDTREGGKNRSAFLAEIKLAQASMKALEKKNFSKLTSFKSGNPKFKKAQDAALKAYANVTGLIKKGDLSAALANFEEVFTPLAEIEDIIGGGRKQVMTPGNIEALGGTRSSVGMPQLERGKR